MTLGSALFCRASRGWSTTLDVILASEGAAVNIFHIRTSMIARCLISFQPRLQPGLVLLGEQDLADLLLHRRAVALQGILRLQPEDVVPERRPVGPGDLPRLQPYDLVSMFLASSPRLRVPRSPPVLGAGVLEFLLGERATKSPPARICSRSMSALIRAPPTRHRCRRRERRGCGARGRQPVSSFCRFSSTYCTISVSVTERGGPPCADHLLHAEPSARAS